MADEKVVSDDPLVLKTFMDRMTKKYMERAQLTIATAVRDMREEIINNTPVDTGFAKASWWDSNSPSEPHPNPPSVETRLAKGQITSQPGRTDAPLLAFETGRYYLQNSCEYVPLLNEIGGAKHKTPYRAPKWFDRARARMHRRIQREAAKYART